MDQGTLRWSGQRKAIASCVCGWLLLRGRRLCRCAPHTERPCWCCGCPEPSKNCPKHSLRLLPNEGEGKEQRSGVWLRYIIVQAFLTQGGGGWSPTLQNRGQNQRWPTNGPGGYTTPAACGVPDAPRRGFPSGRHYTNAA